MLASIKWVAAIATRFRNSYIASIDMLIDVKRLLLLCILLPCTLPAQEPSTLKSSAVYSVTVGGGGGDGSNHTVTALLAPHIALGGTPVGLTAADTAEECAERCRQRTDCAWFNFCGPGLDKVVSV